MVLNHISVGAHQCVFYTCGAPSGAWTSSLPALHIFFSSPLCLSSSAVSHFLRWLVDFPRTVVTFALRVCHSPRSFASSCGLHTRERRLLIPPALTPCFLFGLKTIPNTTPRPRPIKRNVTAEYGSYPLFSRFAASSFTSISPISYEHSYERRSSILSSCTAKTMPLCRGLVLLLMNDWRVSRVGNFVRFRPLQTDKISRGFI